MRTEITSAVLCALCFSAFSSASVVPDRQASLKATFSSMPLAFTANQGQWDEKVIFRANAGGATMWFSTDGAYYQFTKRIEAEDSGPFSVVDKRSSLNPVDMANREPETVETIMIKASFVGANPNPQLIGVDMMEYKCNYFIGNDPSNWQTDVSNYNAVVYEQVYDGIDLKYYSNGRQMEYDFIVSPGADYSQIMIQYEGAESISISENGDLVVETKWGEVSEQRPVIYQIDNGSRITVAGEYRLKGDNSFGFELSSYNPVLSLVIDPLLSYSTYLGGSALDLAYGVVVDGLGNAYITGYTKSFNFPTEGEYQTARGGNDAFVTKLNSSGNALVYSTYLGGNDREDGTGIDVDGFGNAYITGFTNSTNFPIMGEYQTFQGGTYDAFVTKLNSAGNALVYSTYLGGSDREAGHGIAVDGSGNAYITGYTGSTDFPIVGEYQTFQDGIYDVFVTKLNSSGNGLIYSTYLGGTLDDYGYGIALDGSESAYITGLTNSTDFPTLGEYQTARGGNDAFVTKLNSSGDGLVYSTYLGGSVHEQGRGIAVNGSGNAYITGYTNSGDFPTLGEYQTFQGGVYDVFVTKLSSAGNGLVFSTYLGGSGSDRGHGIAVDGSGNAYITGSTSSTDFPIKGEYQSDQGGTDAFVTKLSSSGNGLVYSTYLGGNSSDDGRGIALDDSGNAYITGLTLSTDFPTEGAYQTDQGSIDVFVAKFTQPPSCCVGNRGDLNGDGDDANVLDLTFLVDYIFRGSGNPGNCPVESDVNSDGSGPNVLDLTFLVDRIFRGGPPPGPC